MKNLDYSNFSCTLLTGSIIKICYKKLKFRIYYKFENLKFFFIPKTLSFQIFLLKLIFFSSFLMNVILRYIIIIYLLQNTIFDSRILYINFLNINFLRKI